MLDIQMVTAMIYISHFGAKWQLGTRPLLPPVSVALLCFPAHRSAFRTRLLALLRTGTPVGFPPWGALKELGMARSSPGAPFLRYHVTTPPISYLTYSAALPKVSPWSLDQEDRE